MKKLIRIQTETGWHIYKIEKTGEQYSCTVRGGWHNHQLGQAPTLEGAIALLRTNASKYGQILTQKEGDFVTYGKSTLCPTGISSPS